MKEVQREFQGSFQFVSGGFQGSFKVVTGKILACFMEILRVFQGILQGASMEFYMGFKGVERSSMGV